MHEKLDMNSLSWRGAVEEPISKDFRNFQSSTLLTPPNLSRFNPSASLDIVPGESLPERCERLRSEINHGREYLVQVRSELRENRDLLEKWAQYERTCSLQPLDHLVQLVCLKQSIEEFLVAWLRRKEKKLAAISREIGSPANSIKKRRHRRR